MCIFCDLNDLILTSQNEKAYAIYDKYPVARGHMLIIPFRHAETLDMITNDEIVSCFALIREQQAALKKEDNSIQGFNIGVNVGEVAGQTIFHCHFHLIPRRAGDCERPEGGVRNLISGCCRLTT